MLENAVRPVITAPVGATQGFYLQTAATFALKRKRAAATALNVRLLRVLAAAVIDALARSPRRHISSDRRRPCVARCCTCPCCCCAWVRQGRWRAQEDTIANLPPPRFVGKLNIGNEAKMEIAQRQQRTLRHRCGTRPWP